VLDGEHRNPHGKNDINNGVIVNGVDPA
jgi:hypothetical protein